MDELRIRLRFAHGESVSSNGVSGGCCIFWRAGVDLEVHESNQNFFDVLIREALLQFRLMCCYGPPCQVLRETFWRQMATRIEAGNPRWVVLGDLNSIVDQSEKGGGRPFQGPSGRELRDFIAEVGAIDLGCIGFWHTWSNKRALDAIINERIDWTLVSADWCLDFPQAAVRSFARTVSNHSPIMFNTSMKRERLPTPFCFFEAWTKDLRSVNIVGEVWEKHVVGFESFKLAKRIGNTKRALIKWNKTTFGFFQDKLSQLQYELSILQNRSLSEE